MKYTFVTVAYEDDYNLLLLQAKSMAIYGNLDVIEEIIIIENFSHNKEINWRNNLLQKYGKMANFVRFVTGESIANIPTDTPGWFSQQILKLKAHSIVKTERYVLLDTKNHLVAPLTLDFLETPSGNPRINGYGYEKHSLLHYLIATIKYFNISSELVKKFVRTSTPFTLVTQYVKDAIDYVEKREQKSLEEIFTKLHFAEFFLYGSYLIFSNIDAYDWSQNFCGEIWTHNVSLEAIKKMINSKYSGPFIAIHRGAIPVMPIESRIELSNFWVARGLFDDSDKAMAFLNGDINTL